MDSKSNVRYVENEKHVETPTCISLLLTLTLLLYYYFITILKILNAFNILVRVFDLLHQDFLNEITRSFPQRHKFSSESDKRYSYKREKENLRRA